MADEASAVEGFDGQAPAPKSSVLRLRGLPFSAGEEDVRQFFSDFSVAQVVVCRRGGRSTGEGYVQLDSIAAAADAITKLHRQTMGHRYVEIFESTEADLATAKSLSVDRMRGFVVRCRGLPYTATAQDVLNFFGSDVPVVRGIEGVVFTYAPDGRPTGEAFVELQTEDAQREALKKHKETIGSRYIELFVSTKADMIQAIQQNRMVLGFSNRKRWLQQQGVNVMHGPHGGGHMGYPGHHGAGPHFGGPPHHGGPRRHHHHQYGQVEEVTDMMAGFNMGGHGHMQVIGPNGAVLPPGTYHLEVPRDHLHKGGPGQQRFAYPPGGRGGRGGRGPGPFPGRGGVPMGGRGMGQARYPNRPPPPGVMGVAPMPPAVARQTAQVVPINNGNNGGSSAGGAQQGQGNTQGQGTTQGQQQQSQQQQKAAQQQAQQQAQAGIVQEVGVPQGGQQQQQYIIQQQPMPQQQYDQQQQWGGAQQQAALYAAGQQPGGIQGAYTLATLVPGAGAAGGYGDYQAGVVHHGHVGHQGVVHGGVLQGVALDGSGVQGAGLQGTWGPR